MEKGEIRHIFNLVIFQFSELFGHLARVFNPTINLLVPFLAAMVAVPLKFLFVVVTKYLFPYSTERHLLSALVANTISVLIRI